MLFTQFFVRILSVGIAFGSAGTEAGQGHGPLKQSEARVHSKEAEARRTTQGFEMMIPGPRDESGALAAAHTMEVSIKGERHFIDLTRRSIRSPGFRMIIDDGKTFKEIHPPEPGTYQGVVRGYADSKVALHHGRSGWVGSIDRGLDEESIFIQPVADEPGLHTVTSGTWDEPLGICGVESKVGIKSRNGTEYRSDGGQLSRVLDLTVDVDKAYSDLLGGDEALILEDVESIINATSAVFENDLNLEVLLTAVIIRQNESDYPSNTADELVCDGIFNWSAYSDDPGDLDFNSDVIQIFTGKPLSGVIGYAYIGSACASTQPSCQMNITTPNKCVVASRYTTDLSKRIALSAHEIGHTLGATHCSLSSCRIMCPGIGTCGELDQTPLAFGNSARGQMNSFITQNLQSCLESGPGTLLPPVSASFEAGETSIWEFAVGTYEQYSNGVHPDGSRYAVFEKENSTSDEMICSRITARIDLENRTDGRIEFWLRHQSNSYSPLYLHVLEESGSWMNLMQLTSEVGNGWQEFGVDIPDQVMWEGARFRFSSSPNQSSNEKWLLDYVRVTASGVMSPENDECVSPGELTNGLNAVSSVGATNSLPQFNGSCGGPTLLSDVWFEYEAPCSGLSIATSCQLSTLDLQIRVFAINDDESCTDGPLELLACAQKDVCPFPGSVLTFDSVAGKRYLIQCGTEDGSTGSAMVFMNCDETKTPDCPGDVNDDGVVDGQDLAALLASWGSSEQDLNDDGTVDGLDLAIMLAAWGACA